MKTVFLLFSALLSLDALAILSAWRDPNVDYTVYFNRALEGARRFSAGTPLSRARRYSEATLGRVVSWSDPEALTERFAHVRDLRFFRWNGGLRRSSWLYPDDGCFARAGLANRNLSRLGVPVPNKLFAFGNLRVRTRNSPRGSVTWWYHVVPVVEVAGKKYVLDPAIDAGAPLPVFDWPSRMGNPAAIKVAVCGSGTYGSRSDCGRVTDGREGAAQGDQGRYLNLEWNRLANLGRDPVRELGDFPPWDAEVAP
jgi:hypothetical protein